jgi:undecaprenyl-diphosphatase
VSTVRLSVSGLRLLLDQHDARVLAYLVGRRHPWLDRLMRTLTRLGEPSVIVTLALALLLAPVDALRPVSVHAGFAVVVSHALVQLLKRWIRRPRPELGVGVESLIQAPDRFSFPSGHAAAALALALSLAPALPPVAATVVVATGVLVGVSRCYLGVHYPGDVAAGWVLAAAGIGLAALL